MTVLVLGSEGMLGHKLLQSLRDRLPDVTGTIQGTRDDTFYRGIELFRKGMLIERFDALNQLTLRRTLEEIRPAVVVNCVGIIKQRHEANFPIPNIMLNALLPHLIAEYLAAWNGRVIHFSTDCVFSGRRGQYTEDDPSDAEDLYGKTKYLGEVAAPNALTLRTSIIGRELRHFQSLLEWFLGQRGKTVRGFTRHFYSGVTTNHLAELVAALIEHHPQMNGLYQVASQTISKHDLLCLIRDAYGFDVEIVPDGDPFCDRSLIGTRFAAVTGFECPSWPELVVQLANDPTPYDAWR